MDAPKANSLVHQITKGLQVVPLDGGMPAATIRVDNDRIRVIKSRRILRPAIGVDDAADAGNLVEAAFEQQAAGTVLVLARPVTGVAGDEDNPFISREGARCK